MTTYACASGTCAPSSEEETRGCGRDTDGQPCLGLSSECFSYSCSNGLCRSYDSCPFGERCCDDRCYSICP